MIIGLDVVVGRRVGLIARAGVWKVTIEGGSDHEGGQVATAKLAKRIAYAGRSDEFTILGVHAANGKHSHWVWMGVAGQRLYRGWRVAWWLPDRHDPHAEIPPSVAA